MAKKTLAHKKAVKKVRRWKPRNTSAEQFLYDCYWHFLHDYPILEPTNKSKAAINRYTDSIDNLAMASDALDEACRLMYELSELTLEDRLLLAG